MWLCVVCVAQTTHAFFEYLGNACVRTVHPTRLQLFSGCLKTKLKATTPQPMPNPIGVQSPHRTYIQAARWTHWRAKCPFAQIER